MSTSMPQPSTSKCVVPRPVMPSTTSSAFGASFLAQLRNGLDVVAHRRRSLSGLHENHLVLRLERGSHLREVEGLPVGRSHHVRLAAERLRQARPALAKFAGRQHQHLVARRGQVRHRRLHRAGAGARQQQHIVLRAHKDLELRQHLLKQGAKLRRAVVHVGRGHGKLGRRKQRRRTGRKKACLANHFFLA